MEPLNDDELKQLLREWRAPNAPPALKGKLFLKQSWWRWLLTGSIRIPVPIGIALSFALAALIYWSAAQRAQLPQASDSKSISDFQPIERVEFRLVKEGR